MPGLWVFTRKSDNTPKARFCVGGHHQILGQNYFQNKNYCAVLSSRDNRILLALAASEGFQVYQTDIIQAFLHGKLSDVDIYIKPPARFPAPPNTTLKLKKAIYGLHQAPIKFKQELIQWFQEQQYTPANEAKTIWIKRVDDKLLIHALYADDFLHFTNSSSLYQQFQKAFRSKFDIKTRHVQLYLGNQITVDQTKLSVQINQSQYIDDLLQRFEMTNCNPVSTPMIQRLSEKSEPLTPQEHNQYRNLIGSMLYLSCWTRPDIAFAVSELSRFVSSPCQIHMLAAKHLLRYLKGTKDLGLQFTKPKDQSSRNQTNILWGFVDSDWAGCPLTRRSTTGYVLMLNGAAVAWKSKRQPIVALSTAEAEFVAASSMIQETIYIRTLLHNLGYSQTAPTIIYEDNATCLKWANGAVGGTDRAKHIDLRQHFIHEALEKKIVHLQNIKGTENVADILTKPLVKAKFIPFRNTLMGI
jgi:hypothetical protein